MEKLSKASQARWPVSGSAILKIPNIKPSLHQCLTISLLGNHQYDCLKAEESLLETRLLVTMSPPHPQLGLGQSQSMGRVVPTNQGQTEVLQEPQSGEPGSPVSTQASASRVHELCCLSMRIFHLSCLSKAVGLVQV